MTHLERFAWMVTTQRRMIDRGEWSYGPVTLLEVLNLEHSEVHHCRVLRWLLDPLAHHGLGSAFIRELGNCLHLDVSQPERARIDAEEPRARSRADVVVRGAGGSWMIVIEAKVNAGEGGRQAARLELDWPEPAVLVFLTRRGGYVPVTAQVPERWRSLSWAWIIDTARSLLARPTSGATSEARAREALATWTRSAERSIR